MRAAFVFTPIASPTYVPLGLASLAAHVRRSVAALALTVHDLNLTAWRRLIAEDAQFQILDGFLRNGGDSFFEPRLYLDHLRTWEVLRERMSRLSSEIRRYAETGALEPLARAHVDEQVDRVLRDDPALIGCSLAFLEQLPFAIALARRIAEVSHATTAQSKRRRPRVVFGGAAMSALSVSDLLDACPAIDAVVTGEGESSAEALCRGLDFDHVPGLWFRRSDETRRTEPHPPLALADLPPPDFSDFAITDYFNPAPVLPVLHSRGCAWRRCRFCAHNFSFADHRRKRADAFATELAVLSKRWAAHHFYVADQYVGAAELSSIADAIVAHDLDVSFHVMARPVADYTPALLERAAHAGCSWVSWGVESGSQRLLDLCDKGIRIADVESLLRSARGAGIANLVMMIFGLPTGTDVDLEESLSFIERAYGWIDELTVSRFVLFENTRFARRATDHGLAIEGPEIALRIEGRDVRSRRLIFREVAADGSLRPPRGPLEVARWMERRRWLGDPPLAMSLPSEHLLLYADRRERSARRG